MKTYNINNRTLKVNVPLIQLPFNVWKVLGLLAGQSYEDEESVTFVFSGDLYKCRLAWAQEVLQGALFELSEKL